MINSIFIISTPHHYPQVKEAILHFSLIENRFSVIFIANSKDDDWVKTIVRNNEIINYIIIEKWTCKDVLFNRKHHKKFINYLSTFENSTIVNLFFCQYKNDYTMLAIKTLKPKRSILIDEGTASIKISLERSVKLRYLTILELYVKSLLYQKSLRYQKNDLLQ